MVPKLLTLTSHYVEHMVTRGKRSGGFIRAKLFAFDVKHVISLTRVKCFGFEMFAVICWDSSKFGKFDKFLNPWEVIPMPILEGIGDELIYAALFAAPIIFIFRSSLGSLASEVLRNGLFTVGSWLTRVWNTMWSRGTSTSTGVSDGNGGFLASMVVPPQNDCCSICHDTFTFPCQANCAHWFCGDCIMRVWQHTSALQPCRCPICRRTINLLIPSHFERSEDPEAQRVLRAVANYNRYYGGGPVSIVQRVRDMPLLLRRLMQDLMDPQRALPLVHRTRIIIYLMLMTFYVFSPLDILPEGIFGFIGLLDDFLVMLLVLFHLAAVYRSALVNHFGFRGR